MMVEYDVVVGGFKTDYRFIDKVDRPVRELLIEILNAEGQDFNVGTVDEYVILPLVDTQEVLFIRYAPVAP